MLRWRLLFGALLIAGLLGLCWLDFRATGESGWFAPPGGWLFPLAVVAGILASVELVGFYRKLPVRPRSGLIYVGNLAIILSNIVPILWPRCAANLVLGPLGWPFLVSALAMLAAFFCEMHRYQKPGGVIQRLALAAFAFSYVGVLMSFVVQLRLFHGLLPGRDAWGLIALLSMITVVKMGDSGAYTIGRLFGRHKMAPVLSPGKTWEGFAGALLFAAIGSWVVFTWLVPWAMSGVTTSSGANPGAAISGVAAISTGWGWLIYALVVGVAGLLGDLAESLLKRDVGAKDSSAWLPGFGGVLDILDSLLFAAPVAYLCWILGMVGPLAK